MSINRVVILVETPFSTRDYDRYGIDIFKQKNLPVEVWDFSPFLRKSMYQLHKECEGEEIIECKIFLSLGIALTAISDLDQDSAIISVINFNPSSMVIYRTLSTQNLNYGLLSTNSIPPRYQKGGVLKNFSNKIKKASTLQRIFNAFFRRIPIKYLGLRPANFIIAGGSRSLGNAANKYPKLIASTTKIIWTHTMDFDIYLKSREQPPVLDDNIAVFLDQYFPFHPDLRLRAEAFDLDADEYYQVLSNFFSGVEKELGLRVVIAAHPRSDYDNLPDYFGGREIIRGKTVELVRRSKLVLLHYSTAINFAVFYDKPILFVSTRNTEGTFLRDYIRSMANLFEKQPVVVDASPQVDLRREMIVDSDVYGNYKDAYIKRSGSPEKYLWEIVVDYLTVDVMQSERK